MKSSASAVPLSPPHVLERIIRLRKQNRLTQKEVAAGLGISQQAYSLYERGNRSIHIEVFIGLALLYGTSVDYIVGTTNLVSRSPKP